MTFTASEKVIFCSLKLGGNKNAQADKMKFAGELVPIFESGSAETNPDPWKAHYYSKIAHPEVETPAGSPLLQPKNMYTLSGIFQGCRLFLTRLKRLWDNVVAASQNTFQLFLKNALRIGGLYYGVSFAFDIWVIGSNVFDYKVFPHEEHLTEWQRIKQRFINAINEEGRLSRMANDGVWFLINFISFFITGGASAIINLCGFIFDLGNEIYKAYKAVSPYASLQTKVTEELSQTDTADIDQHQKLVYIQQQLTLAVEAEKKRRAYTLSMITILTIGMGLIFFPPTSWAGVGIITATIVLLAGSVFEGIGKRIWHALSNLCQTQAGKPAQLEDIAVPGSDLACIKTMTKETPAGNGNTQLPNIPVRPFPKLLINNVTDLNLFKQSKSTKSLNEVNPKRPRTYSDIWSHAGNGIKSRETSPSPLVPRIITVA